MTQVLQAKGFSFLKSLQYERGKQLILVWIVFFFDHLFQSFYNLFIFNAQKLNNSVSIEESFCIHPAEYLAECQSEDLCPSGLRDLFFFVLLLLKTPFEEMLDFFSYLIHLFYVLRDFFDVICQMFYLILSVSEIEIV